MKKFKQYFQQATTVPTTREGWVEWWEQHKPNGHVDLNPAHTAKIIEDLYKICDSGVSIYIKRPAMQVGVYNYFMIDDAVLCVNSNDVLVITTEENVKDLVHKAKSPNTSSDRSIRKIVREKP